MRILLHILTRPDDKLGKEIVACQKRNGEEKVVVSDLTVGQADYKDLLERIFAADAVQVW